MAERIPSDEWLRPIILSYNELLRGTHQLLQGLYCSICHMHKMQEWGNSLRGQPSRFGTQLPPSKYSDSNHLRHTLCLIEPFLGVLGGGIKSTP